MNTHFIDMDALTNYSEASMELLEWIIDNYSEDRSGNFASEYAEKLQELHKLHKLI